jgi:hypothetical protein
MVPSVASGQTTSDLCAFDRIPGWDYMVEWGHGTEDEAKREASLMAEDRLIEKVGAGLNRVRQDGIRGQVQQYILEYDAASQTGCAVAAIDSGARAKLDAQADGLEQGLSALATTIAQKTPPLLAIGDIAWDTGCGAGEVGGYLRTSLTYHLGGRGGIRIDDSDDPSDQASVLRLKLAEVAGQIRATALLSTPGVEGAESLGGLDFTAALFGLEPTSGSCCATDDQLGLAGGGQTGIGGLTVEFVLLGGQDVYCEGNEIEPVIAVNRPAKVQIFNVQKDGMAQLIWPLPGQEGVISDRVSMGVVALIASSEREDERLVAVAVPEASRFGRSEDWWAYCELPDTFGSHYFPPGAAVDTVTFTVVPQGRRGCPTQDVSGVKDAQVRARPCER